MTCLSFGKIEVIETLAISQFVYLSTFLSIPNDVIQQINTSVFSFIWKGREKVKRKALINDYNRGGLKMLELDSFFKAQKLKWVARFCSPNDAIWKLIWEDLLIPVGGTLVL